MRRLLETTSVVESEYEIDVIPRLPGQLIELLVEENDRVEAGQVLARLESTEEALQAREAAIALTEAEQAVTTAELAVVEARSRVAAGERAFEQAGRDYERDLKLRTGGDNRYGSVSERTVEASLLARDQAEQDLAQFRVALERSEADALGAQTAVTRARVARDRAELTLERMEIRAPIAGQIAERMCRVGQQVTASAAVFRITDANSLRTIFFRPQRELALFSSADEGRQLELTATAEAVPGASFRITAGLDRVARDGNASATLSPGMLVRVEIVTDRRNDALTVPKRAVRREGEQAFVHRVVGNTVERLEVTEGYTDDEYVEILPVIAGSLTTLDRVIVVGGRDLDDGAPIEDTATDLSTGDGQATPIEANATVETASDTVDEG
jgi:multidrug efflux pump subunit AcrA (membrane-fusion protein)